RPIGTRPGPSPRPPPHPTEPDSAQPNQIHEFRVGAASEKLANQIQRPNLVRSLHFEISEPGRKSVMAEMLLFHHAQGQTQGFLAFADELRAAGHVVHAPDLYDGKTFTDLDEGVGYAKAVGFETIAERGRLAA